MKFSIGDPVYIKSNDEEGVIEEFIGGDMANVKVNHKNYHAFLDDLEHPYLRWFLNKKNKSKTGTIYAEQLIPEKKAPRVAAFADGIYLVFMPVYLLDGFDEIVSKVKIFIYNETERDYVFEYSSIVKQEVLFSFQSEIKNLDHFYLHDLSFDLLSNHAVFNYRFIDKQDKLLDNEGVLQIKPKKLLEKMDGIRFQNQAFFHFQLFEQITPRKKQEMVFKNPLPVKPSKNDLHFDFSKAIKTASSEVDLHIEQLVHNYQKLTSSEIIQIQLKACQNAIDLAIATHQATLILIHGIGKGILKQEIIKILNQTKHIKSYVNEFDIKYGYGATKVFFQF